MLTDIVNAVFHFLCPGYGSSVGASPPFGRLTAAFRLRVRTSGAIKVTNNMKYTDYDLGARHTIYSPRM